MTADLEHKVQSHFIRAGLQGAKRRDWMLFIFFRILSKAETAILEGTAMPPPPPNPAAAPPSPTLTAAPAWISNLQFSNPTLWTPSFVPDAQEGDVGFIDKGDPSPKFIAWLKAVTSDLPIAVVETQQALGDISVQVTNASDAEEQEAPGVTKPDQTSPADGAKAIAEGLEAVCKYELVRHLRRAAEGLAVVRPAANETIAKQSSGDGSPIEIAFTYPGLKALNLDRTVLSSFPDVFKEGMASRAARLGDIGESGPAHWTGELGQSAVHGLLTGGFRVDDAKEEAWARLRRQVSQFNEAAPGEGQSLREAVGKLFRYIGLEVAHIELGQDPYNVGGDGSIIHPPHRHEHFGFRDGISQPLQDLQLGAPYRPDDPLPGGGTPSRNQGWAPIAPGEIFLGMPDEDGAIQLLPADPDLRDGGTYLVFRKLQQDVGGFRGFLARARPGSKDAQDQLAAQFVGRWQNGVSLIRAPSAPVGFGEDQEPDLNNFRYGEDLEGRRCPLGAHVRRSNPRDIGQGEAKRHRMLRRGMAYGGPFLRQGSLGDGQERGLLFIALNARIDLQFELVQSRWLNGGEFLGQAGLNKCPVTGANGGRPQDQFLEAGAVVPLTSLPAFVYSRGGDYFFAPGIGALKLIANDHKFSPSNNPTQDGLAAPKTPDIFSTDNVGAITAYILGGLGRFKRVPVPPLIDPPKAQEDPAVSQSIVFIARHDDVSEALSGQHPEISVRHYRDASRRMMGERLLLATDRSRRKTNKQRDLMKDILKAAWTTLNPTTTIQALLQTSITNAIRRTKQVGVIDLVQDLAVDPLYSVIEKVYGVRGPAWLTELAISLPFGSQHVGDLHPDWLAMLNGKTPSNPRLATLQVWSVLCFSDLVGNIKMQEELKALSMQAGAEFATHLDQLLKNARLLPSKKVETLVDAFVAIEGNFVSRKLSVAKYCELVRLLLAELIASALVVIPATFGLIMTALLTNRANLGFLVPALDTNSPQKDPDEGVTRLIYETNRLNPSLPFLQRYAKKDVTLRSGVAFKKGDWIGAIVAGANMDGDQTVFPEPTRFSLDPIVPGPKRPIDKYLMFSPSGSDRACWGQNRLAMMALIQFVRAASKLPGLRRVAGAKGKPVEILRSVIGLPARFARH